MLRVRFMTKAEDPRPINWPIKYPYWITGYGYSPSVDGDDLDTAIIVAYADDEEYIKTNWPEAEDLDPEEVDGITFSSRFPRPEWYAGECPKAD